MRIRLALSLITLLLFAACGGEENASPRRSPTAKAPEPPKPVFCPLTGVETSKDFPVDRPPLGVKIENSTAARPQVGLEKADIVYEELAEGGITRFLAIYHCSDADSLGPIRSARLVDPDIMLEYTPALFAYSGGNPIVKDKVRSTKGLADLRHGSHGDAYRRERSRPAPHNLFSSTKALRDLKDAQGFSGPPQTGLVFRTLALAQSPSPSPTGRAQRRSTPASASPSPTATAVPAGTSVNFSYSSPANTVNWRFDANAGHYTRFHGETAHKVATGEQISAVNVVILGVRVTQGTIKDSAGNFSPEINVTGSGKATILRGGVAVTGTWSRPALADRTRFLDASGKVIELLPGNTWIQLVPQDRPITVK